jgi:hypothetical protein
MPYVFMPSAPYPNKGENVNGSTFSHKKRLAILITLSSSTEPPLNLTRKCMKQIKSAADLNHFGKTLPFKRIVFITVK